MTSERASITRLFGSVNWFSIDELNALGITSIQLSYINPTDECLENIKDSCVKHMKKLGFVFFDDIGYRAKLNNRHRLIDFGVQFNNLK